MLERLEDCLNPLSRSVISLGKVTFFSFRSIRLHKATVSYYYYEILIQLLTRSNKLYTLHQLIQVGPSPPPPIPTLHSPPPPYLHSTHHLPPYMRSTHHLSHTYTPLTTSPIHALHSPPPPIPTLHSFNSE